MTPLRLFYGIYVLTFAVTVVVGAVAVDHVRWPAAALGALVVVFGTCLVANLFGFATETAANAAKSRWAAPGFASVGLVRVMGVFFALVGAAFAGQALFGDDF